uniref:Uncharacterized protein n=1 Tax=Salarias fasciatus TaxID=181472 RepID=A0A672FAV1_SALFA
AQESEPKSSRNDVFYYKMRSQGADSHSSESVSEKAEAVLIHHCLIPSLRCGRYYITKQILNKRPGQGMSQKRYKNPYKMLQNRNLLDPGYLTYVLDGKPFLQELETFTIPEITTPAMSIRLYIFQ